MIISEKQIMQLINLANTCFIFMSNREGFERAPLDALSLLSQISNQQSEELKEIE